MPSARRRGTVTVVWWKGGFAVLRQPVRIRVNKGPDRRRERTFTRGPLLIGTGEGTHFTLTDSTVSAVHCELLADELGFRVRDLGAKNGVWVAGQRVRGAFVERKDELQLGESILRFELLDEFAERPLG